MDSDMKWFLIIMVFCVGAPMLGMAVEQYNHNQCRMTAIQAGMPAEGIEKVCKK